MRNIARSRLSRINSITLTILDPNYKNGVWEEVSPTEVRLKPNTHLKKGAVREIAKGDFDQIWAILQEARTDASNKNTVLIVISSCAALFVLVAGGFFLYFNAQFSVYHDDQYNFSIKYPATWKVVVHPQANVAVVFLRPKDTVLDTVQENFNVTVQPVPSDVFNLAAFSARIKTQMNAVFGKSIAITEDKPVQWGWREGHIMVMEAPKPDHLKMVNAWVLYRDQAYIMTFLGDMRKYPRDALVIKEMIRSLQIQ